MDISDGHALQPCHAIGNEAISHREGQAVERGIDVQHAVFTLGSVGAAEGGYRHTRLHQ